MGAVTSIRTGCSISIWPSARAAKWAMWTPGMLDAIVRSMVRDSPGCSWPTSNSSSRPARCATPSGRTPSRTTPVATPVPGLLTFSEICTSPPIRTGFVSDDSSRRSGLVARERTDASVRKLTLATLPISPSICGMTSIDTRASPPAAREPSVQTSSDGAPPALGPAGLAGGVVAIKLVP